MTNLYTRFNANKESAGAAKVNLFFKENNHNGYMTKPEFTEYLNGLQERDFVRFERFLEYTFKRFPINNVPVIKQDPQDSEDVVWLKFKLPNSEQRLRIICDGNILRFVQDYQEGKFLNGFLFEDLIKEAGVELAD